MARSARVVVPGYPHHVTQRGNRRQSTFFEEDDYRRYLRILKAQCDKMGVAVWAYCLMPNHVHLIVVPSTDDGLCKAVGETHRLYTRLINQRMEWRGYLWQGRFASSPMDESYLLAAVRYVELNPVKGGLVVNPGDYLWSSARFHLGLCDNDLVVQSPLRAVIDNWRDFLLMEEDETERRNIRVASGTGKPLGTETFLNAIKKSGTQW